MHRQNLRQQLIQDYDQLLEFVRREASGDRSKKVERQELEQGVEVKIAVWRTLSG